MSEAKIARDTLKEESGPWRRGQREPSALERILHSVLEMLEMNFTARSAPSVRQKNELVMQILRNLLFSFCQDNSTSMGHTTKP
jgi:hypothetical protein